MNLTQQSRNQTRQDDHEKHEPHEKNQPIFGAETRRRRELQRPFL